MKLLCCADTHGRILPSFDEGDAVAWLHAGDVANGPDYALDLERVDPRSDPLLAPIMPWFDSRTLPVFMVRGNHDCGDPYQVFTSQRDVTGRVVPIAPRVLLAGIGWCGGRYYDLPRESDLDQVCDDIRRQARRLILPDDNVVLLTHYPPMSPDIRDAREYAGQQGVWYQSVRTLVDELEPVLIVEGHNHLWANTSCEIRHSSGRASFVINPGRAGAIVELDLYARLAWQAG
jgi:Icc-related predicted phosphoesterase